MIRSFLWNTLLRAQRIVMLLTICITTAAVFLEVIMRYFFQAPLVGIEEPTKERVRAAMRHAGLLN